VAEGTLAGAVRRCVRRAVFGIVSFGAAGCEPGSAFDIIGTPQSVLETRDRQEAPAEAPQFDPELSVIEEFDGCRMRVNKSASITQLNIRSLDDQALEGTIFPTRVEALAALSGRTVIPSMEVVNGVLKPFNDGLYAAVELLAETGAGGSLVDKRSTFRELLHVLLADPQATAEAAQFAAALQLAGERPELPAEVAVQTARLLEPFEDDLFHSTVLGFYDWNEALRRIYVRDRFLQGVLPEGRAGFASAAKLARALARDAELTMAYRGVLGLYYGLTNPTHHFDPLALLGQPSDDGGAQFTQAHPELDARPPCHASFSWLPASDSPERKLIAAHVCATGTAPRNLLDALIGAIQSGAIDLTPTDRSGFYDWQLYALETLLLPERSPESRHLRLTQKYRDKLVETFKSLLIQTRETHIKQLGSVDVPSSARVTPRLVDIHPLLPVEPFPTFYLRSARAYGFLARFLEAALGPAALDSTGRLIEDGTPSARTLREELRGKTEWLYGLHLVAAASIGMRDELSAEERALFSPALAEQAARAWLERWRDDPEIARDPRVSVPMVRDEERKSSQNLAVVGIKVLRISASFIQGHEPKVSSEEAASWGGCAVRGFVPFEPYTLTEQSLEYTRKLELPPFTREALRARLAGKLDLASIQRALEAP
jgi:hypothetical protein